MYISGRSVSINVASECIVHYYKGSNIEEFNQGCDTVEYYIGSNVMVCLYRVNSGVLYRE